MHHNRNTSPRRRIRIMAGVVLVTAGPSVSGLLGPAAPANAAADAYIALAVGDANDAPPSKPSAVCRSGPTRTRPTRNR